LMTIVVLYLNRAYAHIYQVIGRVGLKPVEGQVTYIINNMATITLNYTALGDSLSAGAGTDNYQEILPYLLAEKMSGGNQKVILKNRSIPGLETGGLIADLLPEAMADNADIVTVMIGVNDIHNKVSATQFRRNYEKILSSLKQNSQTKIYVINIPFIGADSLLSPPYQALFDSRTRRFNEIIQDLSIKYDVKYIDLYTPTVELFKRSGNHYSSDLFHPSAAGYKLWADIIYDHINQ